MGSGLLPENAPPLGSFVVGAQNLPCSFLGVRFLRTHENNLKLEGPGTSGSGSQNRARALEVTVAGIIFSLALTESISSKANASSLPSADDPDDVAAISLLCLYLLVELHAPPLQPRLQPTH
ncbi:hypothetical protein Tco_0628808 [Tanacetum coccineum]|uniref:Uncharacterized protein n=1 Tax=Tanacetum coccineum TaxID=301880 RepID=A0ABQ4WRE8_9ASTR